MKSAFTFLSVLFLLAACTPEKEFLSSPEKDIVEDFIGTYPFDIQLNGGALNPNISSYVPPKKFDATILRSEYDSEISLTNIHDLGVCVYANVSKTGFTIPIQDLGIGEENVGFNIIPDFPDISLSIKGSGVLIEIPRTDTEPVSWKIDLEYQILYDGIPLWYVSANGPKEFLNGNTEGTCE